MSLPRRINWQTRYADVELGNSYVSLVHRFTWDYRLLGTGAAWKNEHGWFIDFDGSPWDVCHTDKEVRAAIIRQVYGIEHKYLIPSELLYQAGVRYIDNKVWVDTWKESDPGLEGYGLTYMVPYDEVSGFRPPANRIIFLDPTRPLPAFREPKKYLEDSQIRPAKGLKIISSPHKTKERVKPDPCSDLPVFPKGQRLVQVDPMWFDKSWEGRCVVRKYDPEDDMSDEECFYLLDI